MTYAVELSKKSVKVLDKLERKDKQNYEAVIEHLKRLKETPKESGKPLTGALHSLWSCRVGFLRIIYQIREEAKIVFVIAIGHRKNIYEKSDAL